MTNWARQLAKFQVEESAFQKEVADERRKLRAQHGGRRTENGPKEILKLARLKGVLARHWVHGGRCWHCGNFVLVNREKGWPDVDLYLPGGKVLMIEWKGAVGRNPETALSPEQVGRIAQLRALGFEVIVTGDYDQVMEAMA